MRSLPLLAAMVLTPTVASAAPASDPAFLGIGMDDAPAYCSISSITEASPAHDAGMQFGDAILAIDGIPTSGTPIVPGSGSPAPQWCTTLRNQIIAHRPGEQIKLDVRRGTQRITLKATLSTRGEVLNRRLVGEAMPHSDVVDIDNDELSYDLADRRGRTTVVGWFMLESCTNCARVFDRVADTLRKRFDDAEAVPATYAITAPGRRGDLKSLRKSFNANVPVGVADMEMFELFSLKDAERIHFMVVDCRGVVRFVAPVAPDSEDLDAAIDDVLAAAVQAEHQRTSRR